MKALTVRQPWAWLIVQGQKDIENRTWRTSHRGALLIHAAATIDREAVEWLRGELRRTGHPFPTLHTGALIGCVTLTDCVTDHPSQWFDGPIGWVLTQPGELAIPIPARGALGLWNAPDIDLEWEDE